MSTNSTVNLYNPSQDKFQHIDAHWDGYYSWAGMHLLGGYRDDFDATALLNYGCINAYGAPIWHLGLTPAVIKAHTSKKYCNVRGFTRFYYDDKPIVIDGAELRNNFKNMRRDYAYDYCFLNDWWYVPRKVQGVVKLVPLTYAMCGYTGKSDCETWLCGLDIVVRNADTGLAYTYDYREVNQDRVQKQGIHVLAPASRLLAKVAEDLLHEQINYTAKYKHVHYNFSEYCDFCIRKEKENKRTASLVENIKEFPGVSFPLGTVFIYSQSIYDRNDAEYVVAQGPMYLIANNWGYGVQLLCDISEKKNTAQCYCRINVPEFEECDAQLMSLLGVSIDDIVSIDKLKWVRVANAWTRKEYEAFIKGCDKLIKQKHTDIVIK